MVKADAYGHGDITVAAHCRKMGVKHFAVSNINEAERLREHGISGDILILGYTPPGYAKALSENDIIQALPSLDYAEELSLAADAAGVRVRCHIKLDTGMSRIGFDAYDTKKCVSEAAAAAALSSLSVEGIFTHLCVADSADEGDREFTLSQRERILSVRDGLREKGIDLKTVHFLNSAGGTYYSDGESALARFGIMLYGLAPDPATPLYVDIRPVMEVKSAVAMVKVLPAGRYISYGRTVKTESERVIATIPIGYADGYPRLLSNKGYVLINGKKAPIVGRVCMDQTMVDVTGIDGVREGSVATVMGTDGGLSVTADDIAAWAGTISYEIVCGISARVPRVVIENGEIADVWRLI